MPQFYNLKVANMRNEQRFILYPYSGGDVIYLQSDKRFSRVNLRTGEGIIDGKNRNYSNSVTLALCPLAFQLPEDIKLTIQAHLWNNEGKEGNIASVMYYENKELFSL